MSLFVRVAVFESTAAADVCTGVKGKEVRRARQMGRSQRGRAGVAWMNCDCGRSFMSRLMREPGQWCRCYECGVKVTDATFVPQEMVRRSRDKTHQCSACRGDGSCPTFGRHRSRRGD